MSSGGLRGAGMTLRLVFADSISLTILISTVNSPKLPCYCQLSSSPCYHFSSNKDKNSLSQVDPLLDEDNQEL